MSDGETPPQYTQWNRSVSLESIVRSSWRTIVKIHIPLHRGYNTFSTKEPILYLRFSNKVNTEGSCRGQWPFHESFTLTYLSVPWQILLEWGFPLLQKFAINKPDYVLIKCEKFCKEIKVQSQPQSVRNHCSKGSVSESTLAPELAGPSLKDGYTKSKPLSKRPVQSNDATVF